MNVSTKRLLPTYFDKKWIVSVFSSTYFLFGVICIGKIDDLVLLISLSVSLTVSPRLLGTIEKLICNSFFFKSTDSFRRQLSSRRNNLKLFFNECTLWTIFLDNREQASFHSPLIARYCRLSKTRLNLLAFFDHFPSHRGQRDISNFLEESSLSSFRPTGLK